MQDELIKNLAIEGPARTGKTGLLVERAARLMNAFPSQEILVLCSNASRKAQFIKRLEPYLTGCYGEIPVTTYSALVRNTLQQFWPLAEAVLTQMPKLGGKAVIFPDLAGFETSEYLIKKLLAQHREQSAQAFADYSGSDYSIISQLIRRVRLRAENRLTRQQMNERSAWLAEICQADIERLQSRFDHLTARLRVLDNSKQVELFHHLLESSKDLQHFFSQRIHHLIVDDVDETIPAQQAFIRFLAPTVQTYAIAADTDGGTRRGYLNAYPTDWPGLKALKADIQTKKLLRSDSLAHAAKSLLTNWTDVVHDENPALLEAGNAVSWRPMSVNRIEMVDQVVQDVLGLLHQEQPNQTALSPGDIILVMPKVDTLARMQLQRRLESRGIPVQVLTGTQRPMDDPICRSLVLLMQLANRISWQLPLSPYEFKTVLCAGIKLHRLDPTGTENLVGHYRESLGRGALSFLPSAEGLTENALKRYQQLLDWLEAASDKPLERLLYDGFQQVLSPYLTPDDTMADLQQVIRSLSIYHTAKTFYTEPDSLDANILAGRDWLIQIKTGAVSDTPNAPREVVPDAVVIGTPQKIIDFEIERRVHLWLDVRSREWSRTDNAPLYNAWVHSVNWSGEAHEITDAFNQQLTRTRAGHLTRTLMLYPQEKIFLYASELDAEGQPHTGWFHTRLCLPQDAQMNQSLTRNVLRDDQAAILKYRKGAMAITAVPGAGKTFVNVELLLELMGHGIAPERILVLTYMESAARTLQSRLRAKLPPGTQPQAMPIICTIHSLAFSILTSGDHALYLGRETESIEIVDELDELAILNRLLSALDPEPAFFKQAETVLKLIHYAKSHLLTPETLRQHCLEKGITGGRIVRFQQIYAAFHQEMRRQGKLDFTDLITLAIDLLESVPDVRQKYQERIQVIIEDEAQDSSLLLQRFINLLRPDSNSNLIRTGDTNQSITTTFSTAETSVFRQFITDCRQSGLVVEMTQSSRCAPQVMHLANRFIDWAVRDAVLTQAFVPIVMQPVAHANPSLALPIAVTEFDTVEAEQNTMLSQIKLIQEQFPERSIAVLVRGNHEVSQAAQAMQQEGIQAISFSSATALTPPFLVIAAVLQLLENPANAEALATLQSNWAACGQPVMDETLTCEALWDREIAMQDETTLQLYYHLQDLSRYAIGQDMCRLVIRITDLFFSDPHQRSMGYLCAIKAQSLTRRYLAGLVYPEHSVLEWLNTEFNRYIRQNKLPFKMTDESEMLSEETRNRFVQVMTVHRSKGQEFDFVFLPGLIESNYPSTFAAVWLGQTGDLELELEKLTQAGVWDPEARTAQKKREKIEEEARLVYVGVTRARRGLFLSCAAKGRDRWGKMVQNQPSRYFTALQQCLADAVPVDMAQDTKEAAYVG